MPHDPADAVEDLTPGGPTLEEIARVAAEDRRPRIPEPPPVRVEAIHDVSLPAVAGIEVRLDAFYVGRLRFEREPGDLPAYAAENVSLRFRVVETPPERDYVRPVGILIRHFAELVENLQRDKVEFEIASGLVAGQEAIFLRDPAGNWVEVRAWREFR